MGFAAIVFLQERTISATETSSTVIDYMASVQIVCTPEKTVFVLTAGSIIERFTAYAVGGICFRGKHTSAMGVKDTIGSCMACVMVACILKSPIFAVVGRSTAITSMDYAKVRSI